MADLPQFQSGRPLEDELTSSRMNALVSAINSNELQQGTGIRITKGNGCQTVSAIRPRTALDIRPFTPYLQQEEDLTYKVRLSKGFLIETNISDYESFIYHEPDGIETDGVPVLHDIELGQAAYLEAEVDIYGKISGTPLIVIAEDDAISEHYFPQVGEYSGQGGTVRYKLFVLDATEGRPVKFFSGQNVLHYAERVTMINLGDATSGATEYNVLKDYDSASDTINFRNIEQRDDDGETIIAEDGVDSIPFKRIGDRVTSPVQIQVTTVGDKVQIEGNGVDGDNDSVTVVDGLVSAVKAQNAGIWGNILFTYYDDAGGGTGNCDLTMYFENGRLISVDGTNVTGTGTEIDQIDATFTSRDTDT